MYRIVIKKFNTGNESAQAVVYADGASVPCYHTPIYKGDPNITTWLDRRRDAINKANDDVSLWINKQ